MAAEMLRPKNIVLSPDAWEGDHLLQGVTPCVRGFWMDLLCYMAKCDPYGHLAKVNLPSLRAAGYTTDGSFHSLHVDIPYYVLLEHLIPDYDGFMRVYNYSKEDFDNYLKIVVDEGIAGLTDNGIVLSRFMRRSNQKRVTAFRNGIKGGNPNLLKKDVDNTQAAEAAILQGYTVPPKPVDAVIPMPAIIKRKPVAPASPPLKAPVIPKTTRNKQKLPSEDTPSPLLPEPPDETKDRQFIDVELNTGLKDLKPVATMFHDGSRSCQAVEKFIRSDQSVFIMTNLMRVENGQRKLPTADKIAFVYQQFIKVCNNGDNNKYNNNNLSSWLTNFYQKYGERIEWDYVKSKQDIDWFTEMLEEESVKQGMSPESKERFRKYYATPNSGEYYYTMIKNFVLSLAVENWIKGEKKGFNKDQVIKPDKNNPAYWMGNDQSGF